MLTEDDLQSIGSLMDGKIDGLKTMIQREFNGISDRSDKVDDRFDKVDKQILQSEERTKGIIRGEIRTLESKIDSNHGAMISEFLKIHGRINGVEDKIDKSTKRSMQDDKIIYTDVDNIKKDIVLFRGYFEKLGVKVFSRKGAK